MNKNKSVTIIGGGIVGTTIAYELSNLGFSNITVIEKNKTIPGLNQSSTNEGSIHSGIYYPKDIMPLKAKLCVTGNDLMYEFLEENGLPYKKVGKLIIATNAKEEEYLDFFFTIGIENGIKGIRKITSEEVKKLEPNVENVTAALIVPSTGVTSPNGLIKAVKAKAEKNGVSFVLGSKVISITAELESFLLDVVSDEATAVFQTHVLINSAGLYSDQVAKMVNPEFAYEIDAVRGEFYQFDKSVRPDIHMNGMHVYQPPYCYITENGKMKIVDVSVKELPTLLREGKVVITAGVHLSPTYDEVNGEYKLMNTTTISPLKTTGLGKEDYTSHLRPASDFIERVHYFFPHLNEADISPDHTGIMAPLKGFRDFVIEKDTRYPNCIHLVGMESPAWTSCFAIAKHVSEMLK